jgi:[CysO sulfur-carrier protein]-S-L-cysteine hydrolase
MGTLDASIWIQDQHLDEMRGHVSAALPEEACGIVGGRNGRSEQVFPVENVLHSPVRFSMLPEGLLAVFLEMEQQNLDLLAIYHSHPKGPPHPSPTDIAEAYYPEAAALIWSFQDHEWTCQAFQITGGEVVTLSFHHDPPQE